MINGPVAQFIELQQPGGDGAVGWTFWEVIEGGYSDNDQMLDLCLNYNLFDHLALVSREGASL